LIALDTAAKFAIRKIGDQLLKDGLPLVHAPSSTKDASDSMLQREIQIAARQNGR
jgi:hypothetical protein